MDLLKKELEKKRLALQSAKASATAEQQQHGAAKRYMKASELRRLQEEAEEDLHHENKATRSRKRERQDEATDDSQSKQSRGEAKEDCQPSASKQHTAKTDTSSVVDDIDNYTVLQLTNKLRQMGLPVRLFGERDGKGNNTRLCRLKEALALQHQQLASMTEQNEFRLGQGHGIRNPFLERERDDSAKDVAADEKRAKKQDDGDDEEDIRNDPNKRIHRYFKGLLKQWEDDLVLRLEDDKRSVAGRKETNTYKQCKDYIRPLFRLCKKRQLEENIIAHLVNIIDCCEEQEFVRANDAYMDLAIGRAAWPIGVTMVGIHARSGREKIASGNVAHVMNSELQRKYLTSVKRLMTYAQKKSDVSPSKKVSM